MPPIDPNMTKDEFFRLVNENYCCVSESCVTKADDTKHTDKLIQLQICCFHSVRMHLLHQNLCINRFLPRISPSHLMNLDSFYHRSQSEIYSNSSEILSQCSRQTRKEKTGIFLYPFSNPHQTLAPATYRLPATERSPRPMLIP